MKSRFMRVCSIFLVIVLMIQMLPVQVWATEIGQMGATDVVENVSVDRELDLSSAQILGEITENRTEYTKEFRLDNGLVTIP